MSILLRLKSVSKVVVTAVGLGATALVKYGDFVPAQYQGWVTGFIALATLIGAYHAPYAPTKGVRRSAVKAGGRKRLSKRVGEARFPAVKSPTGKPPEAP